MSVEENILKIASSNQKLFWFVKTMKLVNEISCDCLPASCAYTKNHNQSKKKIFSRTLC